MAECCTFTTAIQEYEPPAGHEAFGKNLACFRFFQEFEGHINSREAPTLSIGLPRNALRLEPHDGRSLLPAGGVGITPLIAMAYRLAAQEADFQLHLFVRTRDRAPFLAELTSAPLARHVFLHADDEMPQGQASALDLVLAEVVPGDHA